MSKVYLTGTGPGDPELLTLKAKRIIGMCDTIVYDDLIPTQALDLADPTAEKIYVGKRAGRDYMKQPEINELLLKLAREGRTIARLKGGDPCIFGRGGEEAIFLRENDIDIEIVPGITSAIAGPIAAGIPPTHRGVAASVKFITAHEDPTKSTGFIDWKTLASDSGTLVFLMGAGRITSIAGRLTAEGMAPSTPCALIQEATLPTQKHVISTLEHVGEDAKKADIQSPCIIVVGHVADLSRTIHTSNERPLTGRNILITRPAHLADPALFNEEGARTLTFPLVAISPLPFTLPDPDSFDTLVFTSQNAVTIFMDKLYSTGADARTLAGKEIWCIGPKTKKALATYGINADLMAAEYRAEGIIDALGSRDISGRRICLPRAKSARPYLVDALIQKGAEAKEIHVYETILPKTADTQAFMNCLDNSDTVIFTSPSGIKNAAKLLGDNIDMLRSKKLAAIGPVTAKAMQALDLDPDICANIYTDEGIISALKGELN